MKEEMEQTDARRDFMAIRRAAQFLGTIASGERTDPATCYQRVLAKVSTETQFIRLRHSYIRAEIIDMAWAVLGENRPGGPASNWQPVTEKENS